jgi:hypothetical protein
MNNRPDNITLWPDLITRDFTVISPLQPLTYPKPLRAVGAARSGGTVVVVPLVELTASRLYPCRQPQLWIPPSPGIFTFKAPRNHSLDGSETARVLKAYLEMIGVEAAFLHADSRGEPDTCHEGTLITDIRSGRKLIQPLDRFSPINCRPGLELMVVEASNFMAEPVVGDPDEPLRTPPLLAAHIRALCAAMDAAARTVLAYQASANQKPVAPRG